MINLDCCAAFKHNSCSWLNSCCFSGLPRLFEWQKETPFSPCFSCDSDFMGLKFVHRLHVVPNFWRSSGWLNSEVNTYVGCLFWHSWSSGNCSYDFRSGSSSHGHLYTKAENAQPLPSKTNQNSLRRLVVCFSFRRNSLHSPLSTLASHTFWITLLW